jgi:hypothetical protein
VILLDQLHSGNNGIMQCLEIVYQTSVKSSLGPRLRAACHCGPVGRHRVADCSVVHFESELKLGSEHQSEYQIDPYRSLHTS